jgi:hypothetical protein
VRLASPSVFAAAETAPAPKPAEAAPPARKIFGITFSKGARRAKKEAAAAGADETEGKAKPRTSRGRLALLGALAVLVVTVGGESYYILMYDQQEVQANQAKPPVWVNNSNNGSGNNNHGPAATKATEVKTDASAPTTGAAGFLASLSDVAVASGSRPRLFVGGGQTFNLGDVVAPEFGLRWTSIDDQTRELEFTDKDGRRYDLKF